MPPEHEVEDYLEFLACLERMIREKDELAESRRRLALATQGQPFRTSLLSARDNLEPQVESVDSLTASDESSISGPSQTTSTTRRESV